MRLKSVLALVASVAALAMMVMPTTSEAGGWHHKRPPAGWGRVQPVRHWVYYPRYRHTYHTHPVTDPYAYHYKRPRYYPYYRSGYWRPAHVMRKRHRVHYKHPRYYQSWGYGKPAYRVMRYKRHYRRHW